jgi:hypothetical protein
MEEFWFSKDTGSYANNTFKAKDIKHAIKLYKAAVLFPEQHVDHKFIEKREYNSALGRYTCVFKKNVIPKIFIYVRDEKRGFKKVGDVTLNECLSFTGILPDENRKLLAFDGQLDNALAEVIKHPVIGDETNLKLMSKTEMRNAHDLLKMKQHELEEMRREMSGAMDALRKELGIKMEMLYAIETFLGVNEEIIQLQKGDNTLEEEPLTLFQQVLYMDEELGAWEHGGIDWREIEKFDKWVTKHYKKFLYKPKSACVFRVRRREKDYGDVLLNVFMNNENKRTYFLIRNGDNLYRIWGNVIIKERLFPTQNEYEEILNDDFGPEEWHVEKLKKCHKEYMLGLIYIQGLIERTDVLGTALNNKVNLLKGLFTEEQVVLVRDDEQSHWLDDGRPRWEEFIEKNRETITKGTRMKIGARHLIMSRFLTEWKYM